MVPECLYPVREIGEERELDSQVQIEFNANSALCLTAALPRTSRGLESKNKITLGPCKPFSAIAPEPLLSNKTLDPGMSIQP